jgi:hypothetical protein
MITSVMLARQATLLDPLPITLTPLLRYSCALLNSLAPLFRAPVLCFQSFAHSLTKTRGVGRTAIPFRPPTVHYPLLTTHSPLTTFRMNTCKSVTKQTTLTLFRMNTYAKPRGRGAPDRNRQSKDRRYVSTDAGLPDTRRRDPHTPRGSPALQRTPV